MKINTNETKIFQTKTKTNFTITTELIKPEEYLMRNSYDFNENREKLIKQNLAHMMNHEASGKDKAENLLKKGKRRLFDTVMKSIEKEEDPKSDDIDKRESLSHHERSDFDLLRFAGTIQEPLMHGEEQSGSDTFYEKKRKRKNSCGPFLLNEGILSEFTLNSSREVVE